MTTAPDLVVTTAPDGRTLTGAVHGPADGRPVLFVAGAGTGRAMSFGDDLLAERGVRLIAMDRPGMGGSDPDPARTAASTAADYRTVVGAVPGVHGAALPVVANSQGALYGLALAAQGGASSLVLVSPADEVAHPEVRALLPEPARVLPDLVAAEPARARELLAGFDAQRLRAMILDGADAEDHAVYTAPAFAHRFEEALAQGFARDGAGYVLDTMAAMSRWPVDLSHMTTPVTVLFGERDRIHSPDLGAMLTARIPGARRRIVPGAGGALLWTRAELVLEAALA